MKTIAVPEHTTRRVVRRARFACTLYRLVDEEAVFERMAAHREAHWIASRNCAAYILDGGAIQRSDGDGEPSSTSGEPMLEAMRGHGLTDVLAMMTVDYTGVEFSAADRARTYSAVVTQAISEAGTAASDS
ncbi:YigZ family protein [Glycomyces salinus]|uniref:YigZ family protein n=1 Tax=Glycomyces salinus TaxID=980294 RepID=UPI0018EB54D7|nr:YigZ family protein [Glycomyces salinus]